MLVSLKRRNCEYWLMDLVETRFTYVIALFKPTVAITITNYSSWLSGCILYYVQSTNDSAFTFPT